MAAGGEGLDALCARLATHPGTAAARRVALDEVALATEALDGDIGGADADALRTIAAGMVDRFA